MEIETQDRQALNRGQLVQSSGTLLGTDRTARRRRVAIADGWVEYGGINNYERDGIQARITAKMVAAHAGTHASVRISGEGPGVARGHLLGRALGGSGGDVRNLVPLAHTFSNLRQYHLLEKPVLYHVLRHGTTAERQKFGRINLPQARLAVNTAALARLHTEGYYHEVDYKVVPDYGRSNVYPDTLEVSARCATCGEWLHKTKVIRNVIR